MQAILDRKAPQALSLLAGQLEQGRDALQLLTGLLRQIRNLLVVASVGDEPAGAPLLAQLVDEPPERISRLRSQASGVSPQELLLFLQILTGAYELIRRSPVAQTILELAVIKLATRDEWQSLADISRRLERLGGNAPASVRPAPATPAPQQPIEAVPPPHMVLDIWPAFLDRVGKQKMSLAAYLAHARPLSLEDSTLTLGVPGFALHQEVLSLTDHKRLIERLLGELCGRPITVQYVTMADAEQAAASAMAAEPAAPPIVQDIVNLFNATLLSNPPGAP